VAGKTAVFCLNDVDVDTKLRLEEAVAKLMRDQGFDAFPGREQIAKADKYSARDLEKALHKAGFQSIAQVTYVGAIPIGGLPEDLSFNLHSLPKGQRYPKLQATLDVALRALFDATIQFGLNQISR
jgi:hypothetical protein